MRMLAAAKGERGIDLRGNSNVDAVLDRVITKEDGDPVSKCRYTYNDCAFFDRVSIVVKHFHESPRLTQIQS